MEFALGLDPSQAAGAEAKARGLESDRLTLTFMRSADPEQTYLDEASCARRFRSFGLVFICLLLAGIVQANPEPTPRSADVVRVASYNIRSNFGSDTQDWTVRRAALEIQLGIHDFDVFGVQEPYPRQLTEFAALFGDTYASFVVEARAPGSSQLSHTNPIYYRRAQFDLLQSGAFWFSETPDVPGSESWGTSQPRNCVWVQLKDKKSSVSFFVFNSHFDHQSADARKNSALLLRERITAIAGSALVICTGDFNANQNSEPYRLLTEPSRLIDTHAVATRVVNDDYRTSHGYQLIAPGPDSPRIDHIFISHANPPMINLWKCSPDYFDGSWASDHYPVFVDLNLNMFAAALYYDPGQTNTTKTGGTGTSSGSVWFTGSERHQWVTYSSATGQGSILSYWNLYYGGAGQTAPYTYTTALTNTTITGPSSSELRTLSLFFQGDYTYTKRADQANTSTVGGSGNYGYFQVFVDPGKTLNVVAGSDAEQSNRIAFVSAANNSSAPSLLLSGGTINFGLNTELTQSNANGHIRVGAVNRPTILNLNAGSVLNAKRLQIASGVVNINGIEATFTGSGATRSNTGLSLGGTGTAQDGYAATTFNLNAGTVTSIAGLYRAGSDGLPYGQGPHGIAFGVHQVEASITDYNSLVGGTFNFNGGTLITTDVYANPHATEATTAKFVFNGGSKLIVSTFATQEHLDGFITGFKDTANNHVEITAAGAVIDTGSIETVNTNGVATISVAMRGAGALTKIGANTLTLTGANTYSGGTLVADGTLHLTGEVTSSVTVAGGTLSGSGRIRAGATVAANGRLAFDLPASPAAFQPLRVDETLAFQSGATLILGGADTLERGQTWTLVTANAFSGPLPEMSLPEGWEGSLTVVGNELRFTLTPLATVFELWRESHFGSIQVTEISAATADPDGDGLSNLAEYALGLDPLEVDGVNALTQGAANDHLTLSFSRVADPELTYRVEASDNLGTWTSLWTSSGAQNTAGPVTVTDTVTLSSRPARFLRLQIETAQW